CAIITEGMDTRGSNRTPSMYQKIRKRIEEVIAITPANVGIFCGSYTILNSLLKDDQIRDMIIPMARKYGKRLFIENPANSARKNNEMLDQFKSSSKGTGAVLFGVCGGKNSEGEDYPGDFMNAVVIVGVPYPLQTPRVKAKIEYYDKKFKGRGWNYTYLYPTMQRANQASGRPIRKETDRGVIIFLDERFKQRKLFNWISEWIRKELRILPDRKNNIRALLQKFWDI
ncbi:MAG: helicase C-terminal domain-containing protein, partial [Candidatus Odinarchaeota archaeon]